MTRGTILIDLGNHSLKVALFDEGFWRERRDIPQEKVESFPSSEAGIAGFRDWASGIAPTSKVICASVNPPALEKLAATMVSTPLRIISAGDIPMEISSEGTGVDRLLAAWHAFSFRNEATVVADVGTAFTLDVVDPTGRFCGGAIGPGLGVQIAALSAACPHLAAPKAVATDLPRTTAQATAFGTFGALAYALEGLAEQLAPDAGRVMTGGDADRLSPWLNRGWRFEPQLVLKALAAWWSDFGSKE